MIKIGDVCPLFTLKNQFGEDYNINQVLGNKNVVIYFYPKDETRGCTQEACSFRDRYEEFQEMGCEVIGISSDSERKHREFAEKHKLPFILLADTTQVVRKSFGVPSSLFGIIPGRVTYIIGKDKLVKGIFNSLLNPQGHIEHALKLVEELNRACD
jgi:peroxiredoxin Q/BCP